MGSFDRHELRGLDHVLRVEPDGAAVIDLSESVLSARSVLAELDPVRWARTAAGVCVVCARATGRLLLAQAGVADRMAVFGRTEDALQALVLSASGYGSGWDTGSG